MRLKMLVLLCVGALCIHPSHARASDSPAGDSVDPVTRIDGLDPEPMPGGAIDPAIHLTPEQSPTVLPDILISAGDPTAFEPDVVGPPPTTDAEVAYDAALTPLPVEPSMVLPPEAPVAIEPFWPAMIAQPESRLPPERVNLILRALLETNRMIREHVRSSEHLRLYQAAQLVGEAAADGDEALTASRLRAFASMLEGLTGDLLLPGTPPEVGQQFQTVLPSAMRRLASALRPLDA